MKGSSTKVLNIMYHIGHLFGGHEFDDKQRIK